MENLIHQYGPMLASFLLGIGAVAAFLKSALPTIKKYLTLANSTIVFLNEVASAIEDDNLTPAEWDVLKNGALQLRDSFKAVWSK